MRHCKVGNEVKRFLLVAIFALEFVCLGFAVKSDGLFKPWDDHAPAIRKALNETIPKAFQPKGKAVYIETISREEVDIATTLIYGDKVDCIGMYLPRPSAGPVNLPEFGSMIFLIGTQPLAREEYVVTHEYGHFVYFELLTRKEKDFWLKEWSRELEADIFPTDYCTANRYEGFAEIFAHYVHGAADICPEAVKFLDSIGKRLDRSYKPVRPCPQETQTELEGYKTGYCPPGFYSRVVRGS